MGIGSTKRLWLRIIEEWSTTTEIILFYKFLSLLKNFQGAMEKGRIKVWEKGYCDEDHETVISELIFGFNHGPLKNHITEDILFCVDFI